MNAVKKKSKKQSAANSKRPHKELHFYLDRNMGKHVVAEKLRDAGCKVEIHDDHLPPAAPDEDWISLVGSRGWIAITKDKNIRYRAAELHAIKNHSARVIVVRAKNATGNDIAKILIKGIAKIEKFADNNDPPFVAGIDGSGRITIYKI